jgi:hypothetical protein
LATTVPVARETSSGSPLTSPKGSSSNPPPTPSAPHRCRSLPAFSHSLFLSASLPSSSLYKTHRLAHWELQGKRQSSPGGDWVTLHRSDLPLQETVSSSTSAPSSPYSEGYFLLPPRPPETSGSAESKFQVFRLLMVGRNTSETSHLFCSGVELYGTLFY